MNKEQYKNFIYKVLNEEKITVAKATISKEVDLSSFIDLLEGHNYKVVVELDSN